MSEEAGGRVAALEARVQDLEIERRRIFEDAQREADAVYAQYQLSQLLAAGGRVDEIAAAVLAEVAPASGAAVQHWPADPAIPGRSARRHVPRRRGRPGRTRWSAVRVGFAETLRSRPVGRCGGWSGILLPRVAPSGER